MKRINRIYTQTGKPEYIRAAALVTFALALCFIISDFFPIWVDLIGASACAGGGMVMLIQADVVATRQRKRQQKTTRRTNESRTR